MALHDSCAKPPGAVLAFAALALALAAAGSPAVAQPIEARRDLPWQITSYLEESGISRAHIFAIDFEADLTTWIATSAGLYRFDGYNWRRFTTRDGLPSDFVRAVHVAPNGDLWVGTDKGAGVFDGTRFDRRGSERGLAGQSVRRIVQDPDGTIWFCSDRWPDTSIPGGLTSLHDGVWRRYGEGDGLPHDHLLNYFRDSRGRQFALTIHSLSQRIGDRWGPPEDAGFPTDPQTTWQMVELPDGRLVVQQWDRLVVLENGRWSTAPYARIPLVVTREGELIGARVSEERRTLWFERWRDRRFEAASAETRNIRDTFLEMVGQAPDGSIWCVGQGMLLRWHYTETSWTAFEGLPPPQGVDSHGRLWFADDSAVVVKEGDRFRRVPGARTPLSIGPGGRTWATTADGLVEVDARAETRHPLKAIGLARIAEQVVDARGRLWVVGDAPNARVGVSSFDGSRWQPIVLDELSEYGLPRATADVDEGLWLALHRLGTGAYAIVRVTSEGARLMPIGNPPPIERPFIAVDRAHVWLYATLGAFSAPRDDLRRWTAAPAPFGNAVAHRFVSDTLWLLFAGGFGGDIGISAVERGRWRHFPVDWQGFTYEGSRDSLLVGGSGAFHILRREADRHPDLVALPVGAGVTSLVEDASGTFWVGAGGHVLQHDPGAAPPRARVGSVLAEVRQDRSLPVSMDARRRFAAGTAADRFQFSWKLDDGEWTTFRPGAELNLEASVLPLGRHVLHVKARDAAGNVSPPAAWAFAVLPVPLQERAWFWPALAAVGLLLTYLTLATWRAKQRVATQALDLERKVHARTAALSESEQRFRGIFNSTFQFMAILSPDGILLESNQTALDVVGGRRDDVVGRPFRDTPWWRHSPELQSRLTEAIARAARGEVVRFEAQHSASDGRSLIVDVSIKSARDGDGRVFCLIAEGRDITERKRAEEERGRLETQLRQSQKMEAIGTLAGGIAHDFNNILTGIVGNAELAEMDLPTDHPASESIAGVISAATRARDLVKQILVFSRRQEQQRRVVRLDAALAEALKLLRASLPSTVEIRTDVRESLPVLADVTQIHQVIVNLCTNAAHAMQPSGGRLTLSLEPLDVAPGTAPGQAALGPGRYMRLSVNDTGHGMDAATLERVFEPFFTTKGPGEGTGLGLAVVHGIMQNHDGAITADSRPGEGSVFRLYFPVVAADGAAEDPAESQVPRGSGQRILVVDDEPGVADVAARLLGRLGYDVAAYTDPFETLAAFLEDPGRVTLVLTDFTMPRLTGVELMRRLRAIRNDLPVIVATGFGGRLDAESARELGVDALVPKPYGMRELAAVVHEVLHARGLATAQPETPVSPRSSSR